jgi:hypothetical protein
VRTRTNAVIHRAGSIAALCIVTALLLTACLPDSASSDGGRGRYNELPTIPGQIAEPPTVEPEESPEVIIPEFVQALLAPGSTLTGQEQVFFRNGSELWSLANGETMPVLDSGTRFGPYATSTHGQRAAVVLISGDEDVTIERVHIILDGNIGPPMTPERITSGDNAEAPIIGLEWSRNSTRIAIIYDDATVGIMELIRPEGSVPAVDTMIQLPDHIRRVRRVEWFISSTDLAILAEDEQGNGSLWLATIDGELFEVATVAPQAIHSIADIAWLPGRGRIALVEAQDTPLTATRGSMFSIAPDGSGMELLVSTGNFAPAASIVRISASPDGGYIAFVVNSPNSAGVETFDSAWIVNIDSGELTRVPIPLNFRATDFWWMPEGLLWRAVAGIGEDGTANEPYTGTEAFRLGLFNPEEGTTTTLFQAIGDGRTGR